jgi:hypothetical protein
MEGYIQMKQKEVDKMKEIIAAIDQWLKSFSSLDTSVGTIIQGHAMQELAFLDFIDGEMLDMDELRIMANDELERLGEPRIIKPVPYNILTSSMYQWQHMPYPDFVIGATLEPKTRREELEEMEIVEIRELYYERKVIERKKDRITYILESEKGDK